MVRTQRISRRTLLKFAGAAATVSILDVTLWPSDILAAPAIRSEWTFRDGLPATGVFETPVLTPASSFDATDLSWIADDPAGVSAELRTLSKSGAWSDWQTLRTDTHATSGPSSRVFVAPLLSTGVAVQVRLTITDGAGLSELVIGTLDASAPEQTTLAAEANGVVIPRAGWGANEAYRYEGQDITKPLVWPPGYQDVEKVIVHHTVTDNNPPDPAAAIRAIYYYHAVTLGWGDIGYNYVVDWNGKVYEGRFGGPRVIGGHALKYNPGSMGIALLGTFMEAAPPKAMVDALVNLIKVRAPQVDVTTKSEFVDLIDLANLCGHRDVMLTSCPGDDTYPLLPAIRGTIAGTGPIDIPPPKRKEWVDIEDCVIGPLILYPGNLLEVRMTVFNPSVATILSCDPPPGYIYDEGEDFASAGFPKIEGRYRFALGFDGVGGTVNPYRWGFGAPLLPDEEREVVGFIRLKTPGKRTGSVSTVKEFVQYLEENSYSTTVTLVPPPVAMMPPSTDPTVTWFPETGHNVPELFYRFWSERGGLRRFGYPLTEAFDEVSETDGILRTTQYFERARFEHHPDYKGTVDEVMLGLLGAETNLLRSDEEPFQRVAPTASTPERMYFPETGHTLSGIFLRIWDERGGWRIFGYPISEELQELSDTDGVVHTVQYFERNRFEHHPDYAGTYDEVMLGHLGREVLIRRGWLGGAVG